MLKSFFLFCVKTFILIGTISAFIGAYLVFYYTRELPDYSQLAKYHPPLATRVYSSDGKLIEQYAKENRVFVPISAVPKYLINAFIAAEDKNFYIHQGLDIFGIVRAAISNVNNIMKNRRLEGASTITQQVVKNFLLTNERSLSRKIKEAALSYMVSKTFTKKQILELYLNQTFFGKGAYGVATAAQTYFDKSVEDLTIAEASFIAGLPKAPSSFDPIKNYQKSKERRDYVINRMLEDGYISVEQADEAIKSPIILKKRDISNMTSAGYFAEVVRNIVVDMYGLDEFYTGGLTIITTLDSAMQRDAEAAFIEGIRKYDETRGFRKCIANIKSKDWLAAINSVQEQEGQRDMKLAIVIDVSDNNAKIGFKDGSTGSIPLSGVKWARTIVKSVKNVLKVGDVIVVEPVSNHFILRQIPEINGGFTAVDPDTGAVRAHVGGYAYSSSKFDRVTQANRQPGSLFKAFVYLAALENNIAPNSIYADMPIEISQGAGMPNWRPKNYKGDYYGDITFRTALEKSRNLVTVRVAKQVSINKISELVTRFGINSSPPHYYSMILGALETTLSKIVNAYAMVANGGLLVTPQYIEMIQDKNGKIIYRKDASICRNCEFANGESEKLPVVEELPKERIADADSVYQMTFILEGAAKRGTSSKLAKYKIPIAAKTGTTNDSKDVWHVAFTPTLVVGTYVGYDNPRTLGKTATGSSVALPIVDAFLERAIPRMKIVDFEVPHGITIINVDKTTGVKSNGPNSIPEAFKQDQVEKIDPYRYEDTGTIGENEMFDKGTSNESRNKILEDTGEVY